MYTVLLISNLITSWPSNCTRPYSKTKVLVVTSPRLVAEKGLCERKEVQGLHILSGCPSTFSHTLRANISN